MAGVLTNKRNLIEKANTTVLIVVSVAAFVVVFSIVATKAFMTQAKYQNRVIDKKRVAVRTLKADVEASKKLVASYNVFTGSDQNAIGGLSKGAGQRDGNNATIVLDALPVQYDFPALTTSLESILSSQNVKFNMISGSDDEVGQATNEASPTPQSIAMPFEFSVTGSYDNVKNLVSALERSIRPMQINAMTVTGSQSELTLNITAQTYYQPAKSLQVRTEVVR